MGILSPDMRVRLTVCSHCGHEGRLVIATADQVISRCHVCGDELRSETALPAAELKGVPVAERIRVVLTPERRSA